MDNIPAPSYITSLLRIIGGVVGGWLLAKGYFTSEQLTQIGGSLLALATAGWAAWSAYKRNQTLKSAIAAPAGLAK